MKKLGCFFCITIMMTAINWAYAADDDRGKEIDIIYSNLIKALPKGAKLITPPYADSLKMYGKDGKAKVLKKSEVGGGIAMQYKIRRKGRNPWTVGVYAPIQDKMEEGDVIYLGFWARASKLPKNKSSTWLRNAGAQQRAKPYTSIFGKDIELTKEWAFHVVAGRTNTDYLRNEAEVRFQMADDKHTIEMGPFFVFNLGQEVSIADLPFMDEQ